MKKKFSVILSLAVVVVLATVLGIEERSYQLTQDMPSSVDVFDPVEISEPEVPLADQDVTVDTSTKTTSKTVKLKKKSKKTYTKVFEPTTETSYETVNGDNEITEVKTEVTTQITEKYKKKKKKKTVITAVTTTVTKVSTDIPETAGTSNDEVQNIEKEQIQTQAQSSVYELAPNADENVLAAFDALGFKVAIKPDVSYAGLFDAETRTITLKSADMNIYHELGHFVAFAAGNVDTGSKFKAIYEAEKGSYDGRNPSYILKNSSEYFAESYLNYLDDPESLAAERPQTYEAIQNAVNKITDAQITKLKTIYGSIWK